MDTQQSQFNDIDILRRELKIGNELAFDFLFRTRYQKLCRFAFSFVNNFDISEDIVQDTFFAIWQNCNRLDEKKSIDNYLYVSVRNACLTYLRDKHQNIGIEESSQYFVTGEDNSEIDPRYIKLIYNALESLPLQCKITFKLVVLEEMKYKDVAEVLDISINTVKTQIKIAYKFLREKLNVTRNIFMLLFKNSKSITESAKEMIDTFK